MGGIEIIYPDQLLRVLRTSPAKQVTALTQFDRGSSGSKKARGMNVKGKPNIFWHIFLILLLSSCVEGKATPIGIPVVVGETPANDANAIVGNWQVKDFRITPRGVISGRFKLTLNRPVEYALFYEDILFVEVHSYYI